MENERNYGIDLLKTLSMFGVVAMHILNFGGVWNDATNISATPLVLRFFCSLCCCAVNVFAMITGFLCISKNRVRYSGLISLFFTVLFWCFTITGAAYLFAPQHLNGISLLKCLSPFGSDTFWYFRCYIVLFIFIPFLNKLALAINKQQFRFLLCALFVTVCFITCITRKDIFAVSGGYSSLWLMICYLIGAYIKIHGQNERKLKPFIYLLVPILNTVAIVLIFVLSIKLFGSPVGYSTLVSYVSPLTVVNSIAFVMFFSRIKVRCKVCRKALASASKSSFSVYIAHGHQIFITGILGGAFATLINYSPITAFGVWFITAVSIYLGVWMIDILRTQLFKLTKIDVLAVKIGILIDRHTGFN